MRLWTLYGMSERSKRFKEGLDVAQSLRILPKKTWKGTLPKSFIMHPYEMHDKMNGSFEEKEAESFDLIRNRLKHFKKCYVASSHGKDSLVLVHLIWRVCKSLGIPMIDVWLNNTLNIYKEEREFWKKFNAWLGIEKQFKVFTPPKDKQGKPYTVWSIAEEFGHLPEFRRLKHEKRQNHNGSPECCTILKKASIKEYLKSLPKEERYDCSFIGTRAEESHMRKLGVLQRCRSYFITSRTAYPIQACTPLSFWKKADIYNYYSLHKMPLNPTYKIHNIDRMGCASCPAYKGWEIQQASDPTAERFGMLKKNLEILSRTEPDRLEETITRLYNFACSRKSTSLSPQNKQRLISLIQIYKKNYITL